MGFFRNSKSEVPDEQSAADVLDPRLASLVDPADEEVILRDQGALLADLPPDRPFTFVARLCASSESTIKADSTIGVTTLSFLVARDSRRLTGFPVKKIEQTQTSYDAEHNSYVVTFVAPQLDKLDIVAFRSEAVQRAFVRAVEVSQ